MPASPPPSRRPSRAERKAAAARAEQRRQVRIQLGIEEEEGSARSPTRSQSASGVSDGGGRGSGRWARFGNAVRSRFSRSSGEGRWFQRRGVRLAGFFFSVLVVVGAVVGAATAASPLFGASWNLWGLLTAVSVGISALLVAFHLGSVTSSRVRVGVGLGAVGVVVLFGVGAGTQVTVEGRPYLATSETARAYRLTEEMLEDLYRVAEVDELLSHDLATARAEHRAYEPAIGELEAVRDRYALLEDDDLPHIGFRPVRDHLVNAAHYGHDALEDKQRWLLEPDPGMEGRVASKRATYVDHVLAAGPQLWRLAGDYGFDLVPAEGGVVE